MFALRVNTYIWKSPKAKLIDKALKKKNIKLLHLNWKNYSLVEDNMHFTLDGYKLFARDLSKKINKICSIDKSLLILSDSTVDYWNDHNMFADNYLKTLINCKVTIDSLCGSGFYSMKNTNQNFIDRLKMHRKFDYYLFIGGWNDTFCDMNLVLKTISDWKINSM
jgi:hypothetical protein